MGKKVLVTGGSGYLGQFVVQDLISRGHDVCYTYFNNPLPEGTVPASAKSSKLNLVTCEGLNDLLEKFSPEVIVNTAADTNAGHCEQHEDDAMSLNIPTLLLEKLNSPDILFIQLSTDHVYDGGKGSYKETEEAKPINKYGLSKIKMEEALKKWKGPVVSLRSSVIFGPTNAVKKTMFLQWLDKALKDGESIKLFSDEIRNIVYVKDCVNMIARIIEMGRTPSPVYNLCGPEALSRSDVGKLIAQHRGYDFANVEIVEAKGMNRAVPSPLNISCDNSLAVKDLGVTFTKFSDALKDMWPA